MLKTQSFVFARDLCSSSCCKCGRFRTLIHEYVFVGVLETRMDDDLLLELGFAGHLQDVC